MVPEDIDIAIVSSSEDVATIGEIRTEIDKHLPKAHVQLITLEDFLKNKLPYHIMFEGYSCREGEFIAKRLGISRKALYTFDLADLKQTRKVMFNRGLRFLLASTGAERVGRGAIVVPINQAGEFEDFLNEWHRKIRKKEFVEF
jgi:hypothetical protein